MGAIRKNVRVKIGPFLGANTHVQTAVDNDDKEVSLSIVCVGVPGSTDHPPHDPAGITMPQVCPVCKNEDKETHRKARREGDTFALVDTDALDAIIAEAAGNKLLMDFTAHRTEDLDGQTLNGDKVYFLEPDPVDLEVYSMLVALVDSRPDLTFLTIWASRSVAALYRLSTFQGALAVQKVAWPNSIRAVPEVPKTVFDDRTLAMATQLVELAIEPFDPATYVDNRNASLRQLIAAAQGVPGAVVPTAGVATAAPKSSLADMLAAALAAQGATAPAEKPVAKKRAPRKAKVAV